MKLPEGTAIVYMDKEGHGIQGMICGVATTELPGAGVLYIVKITSRLGKEWNDYPYSCCVLPSSLLNNSSEEGGEMSPRQMTNDEVRDKLLKQVQALVIYWARDSRERTIYGKLDGLAFSILSLLDGSNVDLPGFIVAPIPHASDKAFHKDQGENWYPENSAADIKCDLGGSLHEYYAKMRKK
jgi:hypothetical protein